MGKETGISWCHSTFNPWIGCTKVSEGCKFCYAENLNRRWGQDNWGPGKVRRMTTDTYWRQPISWNKEAEKNHSRIRVFCASLADVFDKEAPVGGRDRLWQMIESTQWLDWLLVTKRPENICDMVPASWLKEPRFNVWYGTSVENDAASHRIDVLAKVPAAIRFLSIEPMIGKINYRESFQNIHWAIYGGESGSGARPLDVDWIRDGIDRCRKNNVIPFVKQLGSIWAKENGAADPKGGDTAEWPDDIRIQEFPRNEKGELAYAR